MNKRNQYLFYIIFAVISTLLNIGIQKSIELIFTYLISWGFYELNILKFNITYGQVLKMGTATILAFIFKYLVDKLLIFKDKTEYFSKKQFRQIIFYGFFAVFTTLIFWGTQLFFKYFIIFPNSEYLGACIGLAAGYTIKFILDRKYVFNN